MHGVTPYHSAVPHENSAFKNIRFYELEAELWTNRLFLAFRQLLDIYYKVSSEHGILSHKTRS